jgi:carboxymethylenebutenolidase
MCFAFDARPPDLPSDLALPPIAGGAGAEMLELRSADGTRFTAALTEAPGTRGPGVLILPDVRGLYRFYAELTERFAAAGHPAIAIDYFGRTAGTGQRGEDFDFMPHIQQSEAEQIRADATAAVAELRERTGVRTVVSVGFCFGGTQSFLAATRREELGLDGVVGFYGALDAGWLGMPSPLDHMTEMRGPLLGLFGGADQHVLPEQVQRFDAGLDEAGVEHEVISYPGAPHSFFDRSSDEHAEACQDAWRRILGFLDQVGAPAAA